VKWRKLGQIFEPSGKWWNITHGMLPLADHLGGNRYRIYFSGRDKDNMSHIGFIEIDIDCPHEILAISDEPILSPGELGGFDDCGASPLWLEHYEGRDCLYYMGWHRDGVVRAAEMTGLAIFEAGELTHRSRAPVLKLSHTEPFSILVLTCIWEGQYYYDSCDKWLSTSLPRYNVKVGTRAADFFWDRTGEVAFDYVGKETRVSCARVIGNEAWFCAANGTDGYRLKYAVNENGKWKRKPPGISLSESGWDSEMQCYPFPFSHNGGRYLLYCGNDYGKGGFGLAVEQ
jgi:hypothetical protein